MDLATLEKAAEEAPIIKLVNLILTDSVKAVEPAISTSSLTSSRCA